MGNVANKKQIFFFFKLLKTMPHQRQQNKFTKNREIKMGKKNRKRKNDLCLSLSVNTIKYGIDVVICKK